jgi:HAD superfamily hydrolase (TIGR01493 family)
MSRTLESLGISLRDWVAARDEELDPGPLVKRDTRLRGQLETLAGRFTLAILTNNSRRHADAITHAIGIRDLFDERIFTVSDELVLKPDPSVFRRVADALGLPPEQCISVGDRPSVDIEPARKLGMRGIVVDPPDGIYVVLDQLIAEEQLR